MCSKGQREICASCDFTAHLKPTAIQIIMTVHASKSNTHKNPSCWWMCCMRKGKKKKTHTHTQQQQQKLRCRWSGGAASQKTFWGGECRGVHPRRTSVIDSLENVRLIFWLRAQMSHYFFVSTVTVQLFFCNSRTSHSRSCTWLVTYDLSLHLTDKHSHNCPFLATFTQHWPQIGSRCCISERGKKTR